ncbi:hypothetical protein FGIG_06946 [Fasciola gigantica]|uniref:Uncharacterized protein n=1 Tax=Fasciola gigantica TaxID=46835 RepID=A0A504YJE9_FASGI|nr:hypothetical protein FGIG_06946 [Fasciola gigantica]
MLAAASDKTIFCLDGLFGSVALRDGSWSLTIHRPKEIEQSKIVACCLSQDGKFLCLESDSKSMQLFICDAETWKYRGSWFAFICSHPYRKFSQIPRRSSSLLFTPDQSAVIFGDKSGNVFRIPVAYFGETSECKDSTPLLGHLSMLSDVAISDCGTLVATSDRDEKVRISLLDQPSVIESFCLGQSAFVTQLSFIPNSEYLLSASGIWINRSKFVTPTNGHETVFPRSHPHHRWPPIAIYVVGKVVLDVSLVPLNSNSPPSLDYHWKIMLKFRLPGNCLSVGSGHAKYLRRCMCQVSEYMYTVHLSLFVVRTSVILQNRYPFLYVPDLYDPIKP